MRFLKKYIRKLYHLIWFLSIFLFFIPNVYAVSFNTNGYSCVNFYNGNQYCSNVRQFDYDNVVYYYGADFSYTPDNLDVVNTTVIDFFNQSFCPDNSSGGFLNFRFYHNYPFTNSVINFIQASVNGKNYLCTSSLSQDGRYSEISCPIASGFTNQTLTFSYKINDLYFSFPFTAGFSNLLIENCNISTGDIINSQNQNTQDIINNNNNNSQDIINNNTNNTNQIIQNNDQNTQDIINSSGSNTQSIIDSSASNTQSQIESQKVCKTKKYKYNDSSYQSNSYLTINGQINQNYNYSISDYIQIGTNSTLEITEKATIGSGYLNTCFYNENKTLISCTSSYNIQSQLTIPDNTKFIRFTFRNNDLPLYELSTCIGGNQAIDDSLNNIDDTLNDSSVDSSDTAFNSLNSQLPTNTVISDLLLLPVRLLQAIVNSLGGTCSSFNLGSLYGTNLIMPCIDIESYLGTTIWTFVDLVFSGMFILVIRKKFIQIWENITNLKGGANEID